METIKCITTKNKDGFYAGGIEITHSVVGLLWRQYCEIQRLTKEDSQEDAIKMRDELLNP